jgi:hypothetical protein
VDTYVQLNDHQALEDLRTYRQTLAVHRAHAMDDRPWGGPMRLRPSRPRALPVTLNRLTELSAHERHAENRQRG